MKKKRHLTSFAKGAILMIGAGLPLVIADAHVQHEMVRHPAAAAYMPLASGLAVLVYKWAKNSRT